jgi:2-desacetyl-2-hydroxyethyl bacteriochlorophyllide A dehydrogenase
MKAVVIDAPHRVALREEPVPRPGEGQILVKVAAAGICLSDIETLKGTRPAAYVKYPVIPGHEWCGTVEQLGPGAAGIAVGDRVAVEGHNFCRVCAWCRRGETNLCVAYNELGFTQPGGFAQYVAVRADLAHTFGRTLPFESAAMAEPLACVVHGAQRATVGAGDTVAVVGPGTLGLLAVGWAAVSRPARIVVIGVDRANEALARRMGATDFLMAGENPATRVREMTAGAGADVVFEAAGSQSALPLALELARRGGTVVLYGIAGGGRRTHLEADLFCLKDLHVHGVFAYTPASFAQALHLIESRQLDVAPLVTHTFPLGEFQKAFALLRDRREPVVKVLLKP